jgi:hypothetical protein
MPARFIWERSILARSARSATLLRSSSGCAADGQHAANNAPSINVPNICHTMRSVFICYLYFSDVTFISILYLMTFLVSGDAP